MQIEPDSDPTRARLGADYLARARRLAEEHSAARSREQLFLGAGRRAGGGDELVGHRPLRPGEDARDLDWELYARLERPFVRERRSEAGERWAVVLDSSRSMGLGRPGKWQRAAEVAGALAACGLRIGARVVLTSFGEGSEGRQSFETCGRDADWLRCVRWLDGRRAAGVGSVVTLCAHTRVLAARRVFIVGDLFDCTPEQLSPLARRGRSLCALALLAPIELAPEAGGAVTWFDPERGERAPVELDAGALERYRGALGARLEAWSRTLARHGQRFVFASTERPFEDIARAAL